MIITKEDIDKIEEELQYVIKHNEFCCADMGICNHTLEDIRRMRLRNMREKLDELKHYRRYSR